MRRLKHPAFQRRHYDRVAKILFDYKQEHVALNESLVLAFVQAFKADNTRFQPERFREAVNYGYGVGVPRPRVHKSKSKKKAA